MSTYKHPIAFLFACAMHALHLTVTTFLRAWMSTLEYELTVFVASLKSGILAAVHLDLMSTIRHFLSNSYCALILTAVLVAVLLALVTTWKNLGTLCLTVKVECKLITIDLNNMPTRWHLFLDYSIAGLAFLFTFIAFIVAWMLAELFADAILDAFVLSMTSWVILGFKVRMTNYLADMTTIHSYLTSLSTASFRNFRKVLNRVNFSQCFMALAFK
jgi:hypothetical protein